MHKHDEDEVVTVDYDLDDWERALTLRVGRVYVCRSCGNRVMVTRGGVGVLDLVCCGRPMELLPADGARP